MYKQVTIKQASITDSKAIKQAIRRAVWQGIKQEAQTKVDNRNYYKPFAY